MNKNSCVNNLNEDELELKHFVEKGNKLKWTWVIGTLVIIICVMYGDAAQWLLAVFVACYIVIITVNYFKPVS